MSADSRRFGRIRGYRDNGTTVGQHDVDWLIEQLAAAQALLSSIDAQEPAEWQFQTPDGKWHFFMNPEHLHNTIEHGGFPIRKLYTNQVLPSKDA